MTSKLSLELATREEALVWTETVLFAFTNVVAVFGNLLTFYAVYRNHRLRTVTNMFVIALAISDILMCTCCMPFTVVALFHGQWIFGKSYCLFQGFAVLTLAMVSIVTMGVIAVNRFFCVVKPEKYLFVFKKQRALIYIVIVWCLAFAGSALPFSFEGKNSFKFQPGKTMCSYTFERNMAYTVTIACLYIAAPLTIIVVCYVKVFRSVSRLNRVFCPGVNPRQLRANVEEAKVTKTLVVVLFGFACCWLPIFVMDILDAVRGELTIPRQVYLTNGFLIYLSSTINPVIYGIMNRQFRREYKALLRKITCFRRQNGNNNGSHNAENDA